MSALVEISEVARTRPAADATPDQLAAWYLRKAAMLLELGAGYRAAAARAEAHARALWPTPGPGPGVVA